MYHVLLYTTFTSEVNMVLDGVFSSGSVTAVLIILLLYLVKKALSRTANVPPGPMGYPIVGSMPIVFKNPLFIAFRKLRKQYGDIFSVRMGPKLVVVINGYDNLREAFVKNADVFSDRPDIFVFHHVMKGKGVAASSGQFWKDTRTFAINTLRGFGFGKRSLESQIMEEVEAFLQSVDERRGKPYDIRETLQNCASNVIWGGSIRYKPDENLRYSVVNFFIAGTQTTANTAYWAILFLLHHKDVQDRLRQEIEKVVGSSRLPSLEDKDNMPYFEAFITETMRVGNVTPTGVPHGLKQDVNFKGYTIPKGTVIFPALDSVMNDPEFFENPSKFDPTRFLDKDGNICHTEKMIAFSLGRRVCMGESLARMELFLFLTSLVQRYRIIPEDDKKLPTTEALNIFLREPQIFNCKFVKLE